MRALIARILASISHVMWVTREVVVGGVRKLVSVLVPASPMAMADAAADIVAEGPAAAPAPTEPKTHPRKSLAARVKAAAKELA